MKYVYILCKKNAHSFKFKINGTYNDNCTSKGLTLSVYKRNFLCWGFPYEIKIMVKQLGHVCV
jgi:hypothetical protein